MRCCTKCIVPDAFQAVAKGCHYIFLPSFITSSCLTIDNPNSTTMCPPQFCEWLNSKYGFHTIQGNRVECSLHHGMNQPVQNVRPTTLSPNKYKLDNMRRDNLKFCDAFFWGFDAQQPPAYKAGLAVRHTIDFSIGTGKSRDWHEIANSLGYEIWNGQFYG